MRKFETNGSISVQAIAGTYVVLLGFDAQSKAAKGLLGFAIQRTDHTESETYWLDGFKTFKETMPNPTPGQLVSTKKHPIQGFLWGDYTAKPNHKYTYRVVPLYGTPEAIKEGNALDLTISTENEDQGVHAIYFNRGVAGSQAYARKFGDKPPSDNPKDEQHRWLSRGLEEAMLAFIGQAVGKGFGIRAAAYEFSYEPVLQAFKSAADRGADVKIVYDARKGKDKPVVTSDKAIEKAGIRSLMIPRTKNASYISHNKFIVLLKDGEPVEVWTGSTNFTESGIFGQSNVGHVVRDSAVAKQYLKYWETLATDPDSKTFKPFNTQNFPAPEDLPPKNSISTIFSPQSSLAPLEWYAKRMDAALSSVHFTAAFGVNTELVKVLQKEREYLRYVILDNPGTTESVRHATELIMGEEDNRVAIGAVMETGELHRWLQESLSGLNKHVKFLHTKYMLIDALGDDPLLFSGSANFSSASTVNNDENMLVIRGDSRVADVYLGEFMRIFNHFYFRDVANRQSQKDGSEARLSAYLASDDSWTKPYYEQQSVRWKERMLFRGRAQTGHGITFFDIDETIFHTFAKVWVMKDGEVVAKLSNQEYNSYKLKEGESFDYREFKDAEIFEKTSRPIKPTVAKISAMMKNALRTGSKIALLTARGTFPDMATFKRTFAVYGIPIEKMDINFAGDISDKAGSVAEAKATIVRKYLSNSEYKRARLVDDDMNNLKAFLALHREMPDVDFESIHIDADGHTKTIKA